MKLKLIPLFVSVALALAACGGGSSTDSAPTTTTPDAGTPDAGTQVAKPAIASFTVSPDSLPVGGGTVTLSWSVSDATQIVIDQGVGDVTGKSSVEVDVKDATTFTLTATNRGGSVTAAASVSVEQAKTVTGRVIDARGNPEASATVVISGMPATVTDNDGNFSISGVASPYTVTVVAADQQRVVVYQDLTATNLTLTLLARVASTSSATISGSVSGGNSPYSNSNYPWAGFVSQESEISTSAVDPTSRTFAVHTAWPTTTSTTGTLFAIQPSRDSNGNITGYTAWGRKDGLTLNPNSNVSAVQIAMNTVSSSTLTGSINAPAGYTVKEVDAELQLDPVGELLLFFTSGGGSAFGFNVPLIPQSSYGIIAMGWPNNRVNGAESFAVVPGLTPGNNGISLTLPQVPSLGTPVDQANAVDASTQFVWTPGTSNAVFDLRMWKTGSGSPLQIDVVTSHTSTALPDLSALGLALPSSTDFSWYVLSFSPFQTIDEAATTTELESMLNDRRPGGVAISDFRSFVTK